jgi:alpha-beta hydrolase superfamily lysophospholipase
MKSPAKPEIKNKHEGHFFKVSDGHKLFIYDYRPIEDYNSTIFIISGITGINHHNEKDIIELLSDNENRVIVIHPRGTGYSDGVRGDISNFADFMQDYLEIILNDKDYNSENHNLFLFGHSMSTAVLLAVADHLSNLGGAILINPPYIRKSAKGMTPGFWQYLKFVFYYLFAKHIPIVNMAGDSSKIKNEEDRRKSEKRENDALLVKYFSIYYMIESRKLINLMLEFCKKAEYPLQLIYGMKDNIVDKKGCDLIYENWKHKKKQYVLIGNGPHGKSTVILANEIINKWIKGSQNQGKKNGFSQ